MLFFFILAGMAKKNKRNYIPQQPVKDVKKQVVREAAIARPASKWPPMQVWVILAITFIVFMPLSEHYVTWDDPEFVYRNPNVVNFTFSNFFESIKNIFSTTTLGGYTPMVIFSFCIEKIIFGIEHPVYIHFDNLLLHLLCTYLVFCLCKRLKFSDLVCFIVALLFGMHPMRVESVAWITERKDVLYGAFYLSGLLMYIKYRENGEQKKQLYLPYLFFILALFSKIQSVTFPISLLLIEYYRNGKVDKKSALKIVPFFVLALLSGMLGIFLLKQNAVLAANSLLSIPGKFFLANYTVVVYLIKSVVPYPMLTLYPYPTILDIGMYASVLIIPALLFVLYMAWKRKNKMVIFGLLFFLVNIAFTLQVLVAGQGFMADRYTYIAYLGLFIIFASLFEKLEKAFPGKEYNIRIGGVVYLFALSVMCYLQNKIWENSETLWTHVISYYGNQGTPYVNRAVYYYESGNYNKAVSDYTSAISIEPKNADLYIKRGSIFFEVAHDNKNLLLKSLKDCDTAIALRNNDASSYNYRANVYGNLDMLDSAMADANKSIALDSTFAPAYNTRSMIYGAENKTAEANRDKAKYLSLTPDADKAKIQ